ncbi:MAG: hypothetical protein ACREN6_02965 [Gemmatimonadaceae bacterium]
MDSERSDISTASVIVAIAIHAVIIGALIYNVRMSTGDVVRPVVTGAGGSVRRDRDTTGTWQGSFVGGARTDRIVLRLSDARVKCLAEMWGIDDAEPDRATRGSAALLNDSTIQITVPALRGRFEGDVTANGTVISGTWTTPGADARHLQLSRTDTAGALRDLSWCR